MKMAELLPLQVHCISIYLSYQYSFTNLFIICHLFVLFYQHTRFFFFLTYDTVLSPPDVSQGALRFAPVCLSVCVCLSVRSFVTLYGIQFV